MKCDDIEIMISGYVDGELTQQESQRVAVHIDSCEACRGIFRQVAGLKEQMAHLSYPNTDEEMLARIEADLSARAARWLGWGLLILGGLIACAVALYGFFFSPDTPLAVRLFYGLLILGGLALFISVLRQRLLTYKNDKYRRVKL